MGRGRLCTPGTVRAPLRDGLARRNAAVATAQRVRRPRAGHPPPERHAQHRSRSLSPVISRRLAVGVARGWPGLPRPRPSAGVGPRRAQRVALIQKNGAIRQAIADNRGQSSRIITGALRPPAGTSARRASMRCCAPGSMEPDGKPSRCAGQRSPAGADLLLAGVSVLLAGSG
jgi:hypothetical protein